jgi:putative transcriptional regulator
VTLDLTGQLLIAMPGMGDPRFERAVVLMCSHGAEGAMGLIVNKPAQDLRMEAFYRQLDLTPGPDARADALIHFGGPVEGGRGFVLHSRDYASRLNSLTVHDAIAMTATLDVVEDMARGQGPQDAMMCLGYSGWGAGQLEGEIAQNAWLNVDPDPDLVFGLPDARKWEAALRKLGIDPILLSASAGRA